MFLTFDTETTGLPKNFNAPVSESENWPRLVQLAWQLNDNNGRLISVNSHIIKPDGYSIPYNSEKIHGISTEIALKEGKKLAALIEGSQVDIIDNCGHMMLLEEADRVLTVLKKFITTNYPPLSS